MKVVVMGNGAWGRAVGSLFEYNKNTVQYWKERESIPDGSIAFLAIPTQAIRDVLSQIGNPTGITVINGAKGIEKNTHLLPYQIVNEVLQNVNYLTLMGPSFAEEVVAKMPTLVNLGYRDKVAAEKIKDSLQTDYFRIKLSKSVRALELSAAFKNVYAIACGVAEGLGYRTNTRVKLMLIAIEELNRLRDKLEFKVDENALPATVGDLVLTCSSSESRNYLFGKYLAHNLPDESLKKVRSTVEGYDTAEAVPYFEKKTGISLPLARLVHHITRSQGNLRAQFEEFVKQT